MPDLDLDELAERYENQAPRKYMLVSREQVGLAIARVRELEGALGTYGWHTIGCDIREGMQCGCGYAELELALAPTVSEERPSE